MSSLSLSLLLLLSTASAQTATQITAQSVVTAVTGCHQHGATQYCMAGSSEYQVLQTATATTGLPAQYTGCHSHGSATWCIAPDGDEVQIVAEGAATTEQEFHDHAEEDEAADADAVDGEQPSGQHCHFHAGVEHCVGAGESESESASSQSCGKIDRNYNIPLRIGLLFVVLVTSAIGVFGPILITSFSPIKQSNFAFVFLKQFGTGVIFSTAFVHLFTHATLMFTNPCVGELGYEGTTAAILMAGVFISFLIEYLGQRYLLWNLSKKRVADAPEIADGTNSPGSERKLPTTDARTQSTSAVSGAISHQNVSSDALGVFVLEAGIIFHSLLIGLTLVVSGDSFFLTLFAVIVFHQVFEGIALGSRIAALSSSTLNQKGVSLTKKLFMALAFALTTPIGMAIGIGVLKTFNGRNKATLIAIGTLDAFSAGILVWVGIVEMWAHDWMEGELANAGPLKTGAGMVGLLAGAALMSLLGKWA